MPRQLSYADEDCTFSAAVRRATLGDELRRLEMREAALKVDYSGTMTAGFALSVLPSVLAATSKGELTYNGEAVSWPPTLDDVLERLPRVVLDEWMAAVYELNPDWKPLPPAADEAEEKKDSSQTPTTPPTE